MSEIIGYDGSHILVKQGENSVILDTELNVIVDSGLTAAMKKKRKWKSKSTCEVSGSALELATGALASLEIKVLVASGRLYTIPSSVQDEAKKALEWRKEHKRGGTPVGLNTARTLARGGQIGIEKIRHIAKYFPRHEVDKKGKGWGPGEDKFPSNGRIAWALWGGEPAKRWASAIVERENKKEATTAGGGAYGFVDNYDYEPELDAFRVAHELDPHVGPEFMCRIRLDNSGIDRLYKIEIDGQVYLWDGSSWDDMGHVSGDVYSYDKELDEEGDETEKTHVMIDPSSAVVISAFLQERPFQSVLLSEIDPEETDMMMSGLMEEDFTVIDRVLVAAGTAVNQDGNFTPEERAALAEGQPRDATGRFAKVGNQVVIADDYARGKGTITAINSKDGTVDVMLENGKQVTVPSNQTKATDTSKIPGPETDLRRPLDLSGILGEPRTPYDMPKAHLPGTMKPMTKDSLNEMLTSGWDSWVKGQRQSFKPAKAGKKQPPKKAPAVSPTNVKGGN